MNGRFSITWGRGTRELHVTRFDIVLAVDPFARESIPSPQSFRRVQFLPGPHEARSEKIPRFIRSAQPPASGTSKWWPTTIRLLINGLVVAAVLAVLLLLRLGVGLAVYLVGTVIFSYLASLGVTFAVFWSLDPDKFPGLAWTVPLFLFVVLVAVGIDYNIFLISRVREESERNGQIRGVGDALARTGTIISSCGIIMAGTFSALLFGGHLAEMRQLLDSRLAFGILLDTCS